MVFGVMEEILQVSSGRKTWLPGLVNYTKNYGLMGFFMVIIEVQSTKKQGC